MSMITISTNHIIYAACFALIILVCIYYLLTWQIKEIVNDELSKDKEIQNELRKDKQKERKKKLLLLRYKHKQLQQTQQTQQAQKQDQKSVDTFDDYPSSNMSNFTNDNMDIDSYVDPAEGYHRTDREQNENNIGDNVNSGYSGTRLDKNDIMTRDIADGLR